MANHSDAFLDRRALWQLHDILWPRGEVDHQWSPDTLGEISAVLHIHGYGSDAKRPREKKETGK
jgi:hypothetical protein